MIVRLDLLFLCVIGIVDYSTAKNDNYTFTYAMAMQCSEHICQHGYNYETFYRIDDTLLQHAKVKIDGDSSNPYFEMHIAIQAASNGHILLSPIENPGPTDAVYEIVVGGGGNRFTELRLNLKKNAKSSAKTPKILSPIDFTAFYIKIHGDGLVEFGKEGDSLPLLSYYDPNELPIKFFSFASWTGVEAKFLYDCPGPENANETIPNSQAVEPKLSHSDELKRSLLLMRLPSVPPAHTVNVKLGVVVSHVAFDARTMKLTTYMGVVMSWTDDSMAWNPNKFNGTTRLRFSQGQIWRPIFFVMNSDSIDTLDTRNPDLISMVYSGECTFHFQAEVTSRCTADPDELIRWPHDEYTCLLAIEPWEVHERIVIEELTEKDSKLQLIKHLDQGIPSGSWDMTYETHSYDGAVWNKFLGNVFDNVTHQSDRFTATIYLKRKATTHNIAFYTPLLVLTTFILVSFCGEPLDPTRESLYGASVVVICVFLSFIDSMVPTHSVPTILYFYITVMYGVIIALFIHVFLTSPYAKKLCETSCMQGIFTFSLFRIIFRLPPVKISLSEYQRQDDDDDEEATTSTHFEEMERDGERTYGDAKELGEVLDKLMFVLYSITFASMLANHY